jgi:hypothetical protein
MPQIVPLRQRKFAEPANLGAAPYPMDFRLPPVRAQMNPNTIAPSRPIAAHTAAK